MTAEPCANLLQIAFLSPQLSPILYTKTILSDCATASFVESGPKAKDLMIYDRLPFSGWLGLVENLSRLSPFSSNKRIVRSEVPTASFTLLGDHAKAAMRFSWS